MQTKSTVLVMGLLVLLVGCTAADRRMEGSKFIAGYPVYPSLFEKNPNPSGVKVTDRADTYTLCHVWITNDWLIVVNHEEVLETVELNKDERIGFEVDADGGIVAVFGSRHRTLLPAHYSWYRKKTPGEISGEVIAYVALGVAMVPLSLAGRH